MNGARTPRSSPWPLRPRPPPTRAAREPSTRRDIAMRGMGAATWTSCARRPAGSARWDGWLPQEKEAERPHILGSSPGAPDPGPEARRVGGIEDVRAGPPPPPPLSAGRAGPTETRIGDSRPSFVGGRRLPARALEVPIQEREDGPIALDLVLLLCKTVPFVGEDDIFDGDPVLLDCGHDVVRFRLDHAGVIRALQNDQRLLDLVRMEEGRDVEQHVPLLDRIANLFIEGDALRLPPGRDALKRPHPVRDAEEIHTDIKHVGLKGQPSQDHVAAVATPDDADPALVHVGEGGEIFLGLHTVPQGLVPVLLVVRGEKALSIAGATPVVDAENDVAMVHEVLDEGAVALSGLATGAAVDPNEGGGLGLRRGLLRLPEHVRNLHAVERLEAHDLRLYEVLRVDLLGEGLRKPVRGALAKCIYVEVARRPAAAP